eukprot:UN23120
MHNTCVFDSFACMHKDKFLIETTLPLEEIAEMYGVYILMAVQTTHTFDVNGCDALLHSAQKNGCGVFLHLYVRNILYGTGSALVKRFVILELFRDASCGHSVGMRTVRLMRAWSLKRYGNGTKIQK